MNKIVFVVALCFAFTSLKAQVWMPDNGNGTYKNPVIYADYSDPDVIRVKDDYYLVASSFNCQPGIPVLHSKDLVNWKIINYVYDRLPLQRYQKVQPGQGSWAPSIRYHNGLFYVYFCTPEEGLFMASASTPAGKWTLTLVQSVANWEDPCPFWDADGQAYLLHGKVGAGPAILHRMSSDGKKLLDNGKLIYQDDKKQPTLEGFKFMEKRNGYYYFAAPAGGVGTGWQSVFRSKNIYGPYEDKIVLQQGNSAVNGPHQGGLVETQTGEWWFMHFQDREAYGRIVHLQPATWKNDWPVIGEDKDGDGTGEPVLSHQKPNVGKSYPASAPQTSDEFSAATLGLQWQWQAAPEKSWYSLSEHKGFIRLKTVSNPTDSGSLFYAPNILLQKFTAPSFTAVTKMQFHADTEGDRAGLAVTGTYFTSMCIEKQANGNSLIIYEGKRENRKFLIPKKLIVIPINSSTVWMKVSINSNQTCQYAYSLDGIKFLNIGSVYPTEKGIWVGAKVGIFCLTPAILLSKGYADFDFFSVTP
ncbi:MAG: glycoside hydrolase family 43 protein [Janthinobacterium lividum]